MLRRSAFILLCLLTANVPAAAPATAPSITVERIDPTAERITFDRNHPPTTMPALRDQREDAWTQFFFNCEVKLKYEVVATRTTADGRLAVTARVRRVTVTTSLKDTIFLPLGAPQKLKNHEEGHRKINEQIYAAEADRAARDAAKTIFDRDWQGTGIDEDSAGKSATDVAVNELCKNYLKSTAEKALGIGQIYDELTMHGKNARLTEDDAIRQATARYE